MTSLRYASVLPASKVLRSPLSPRHDNPHVGVPVRNASGEPESFVLEEFAAQFAFVVPDAVVPELAAPTKQEAIEVLVGQLAQAGAIPPDQQNAIAAAVLGREELGTTGIGRGVALPHAKHAAVERVVAALGYSPAGLDFNSIDDERVHLICLILSPLQGAADHLLALQALSQQIANQDYWAWRSPRRHHPDEPAA